MTQDSISHAGKNLRVYNRLRCYVYERDAIHRDPHSVSWNRVNNLGGFSFFLGLNHPLIGKFDIDLYQHGPVMRVARQNCVYLAHQRLHDAEDTYESSYWVRLQVGAFEPQISIGGYFEDFKEEAIDKTQTHMSFVPRLL